MKKQIGAPQSMKLETVASPFPYDAAVCHVRLVARLQIRLQV
jgi:hypothetical protein